MSWLIADIGATTSRCAVLEGTGAPSSIQRFANEDFDGLEALLDEYLSALDERPAGLALAVAAPVYGDEIRMINRDWAFSGSELARRGNFAQVEIINDFHAIAWALPSFGAADRVEIGSADQYGGGNMAALGPGSGLGAAAWIGDHERGQTMTGEGGHITMSARDDEEERIIARMRERYGHVSAERVLSGPGLRALHEAMHGKAVERSEDVTGNPDDPDCAATLNRFFLFLASAAAEVALITGAFGGVYIAGGIVPAHIELLQASPFRERFDSKNRYRYYMRRIPTYVITDPYPGLSGLAEMIRRLG